MDYEPFGRELPVLGARVGVEGYGSAVTGSVKLKFTGKERDAETGLDYFGARYFSGAQGRFTSPDPLFYQAEMAVDPQRFNLYSYARNNPLKFVDPTGKEIELTGTDEERKKLLALLRQGVNDTGAKYVQVRERKGLFGLGRTRYFVDIKNGAEFSKTNATAADLAKLVQHKDTVQVGIVGGNERLDLNAGLATLNAGGYEGITGYSVGILGTRIGEDLRSYIKDPTEGYSDVPGYKMSDGTRAPRSGVTVLFHELGHAWGAMNHWSNQQIIQSSIDLENKVRRVHDPKAPIRVGH